MQRQLFTLRCITIYAKVLVTSRIVFKRQFDIGSCLSKQDKLSNDAKRDSERSSQIFQRPFFAQAKLPCLSLSFKTFYGGDLLLVFRVKTRRNRHSKALDLQFVAAMLFVARPFFGGCYLHRMLISFRRLYLRQVLFLHSSPRYLFVHLLPHTSVRFPLGMERGRSQVLYLNLTLP